MDNVNLAVLLVILIWIAIDIVKAVIKRVRSLRREVCPMCRSDRTVSVKMERDESSILYCFDCSEES